MGPQQHVPRVMWIVVGIAAGAALLAILLQYAK